MYGKYTHAIHAGLLLIALIAPFGIYPVFLMKMLCFALYACAFNLLLGYAGLLSFGHAAFFGLAAYTTGHVLKELGLPTPLGLALGPPTRTDSPRFLVVPRVARLAALSLPRARRHHPHPRGSLQGGRRARRPGGRAQAEVRPRPVRAGYCGLTRASRVKRVGHDSGHAQHLSRDCRIHARAAVRRPR